MAAKKTTKPAAEVETKTVETVEEVKMQEEVLPVENKPANKIIIAKTATPFRKFPTLLKTHIVGQMPVGTAFEIVMTVNNAIGTFYKLNNGKYITTNGNYTIQ